MSVEAQKPRGLLSRLSPGHFGVISALVGVIPLGLLTYFSVSLASDAVEREAEARMSSTASLSANVVRQELNGLTRLVESYAARPSMVAALRDDTRTPAESARLRLHLSELQRAHPGIYTAFVAEPDGTLIDVVPATPSIVGRNYSHRDWYRGLTRSGFPYVSAAYRTQAAGEKLVVAGAVFVRDAQDRQLAILVAAYSLDYLQDFAQELATAQEVTLRLTDQRGALVAAPGRPPARLVSQRSDPRVAAALAGESGTLELDSPDGRRLSAYAPVVPDIGWTVTASLPASAAFASVGNLRSTVFTIAGILGLILLGALILLVRALRERHKAESEVHRLVNINRAVLDAAPDAIFMVDAKGRMLAKNAATDLFGEAVSQETGRPRPGKEANIYESLREAAFVADPEPFRRVIDELAADPELEATLDFERTHGQWFRLYTAPVRDGERPVSGRIFVLQDRTAEREGERMKSELVATVSHELRTPLASILGFAELLGHRAVDDETFRRYVDTIHGEAFRLTNLVNDFLDLQRIEEGRFTLALEAFDLAAALREQVAVFRAQSNRHELELELPEESVTVLGDYERVAQLVGNLLSNAIKYSPQGGPIRVRCEPKDGSVEVAVTDSGLGIPADQQGHLFTKFFRVDTSDTREIGGTGLGLALCREIVDAHGGHIGFDSVEGEGSTFWFTLPAAHRTNGRGPRRILVVEDDPAAASLLGDYLGADHHTFEFITTGEHALARALEDPPALICLDIALAGQLSGWDVLAQLKANAATAEVPVIVCTGRNGEDRAAALGTADFITKPFTGQRIREAVARVLPADGRGSVLVVDDDPAVRLLVCETLGRGDIEVREAEDGEQALAAIAAERPDAVVLDLVMPVLDGFHVLERLQDDPETRFLPVIVLTARQLSAEERAMLRERAASVLEKSAYSPQELRRLVERALAD